MMTTPAGTIPPARVLVIGAGVAGLQAIATAHRLGARVEAYDTLEELKDQQTRRWRHVLERLTELYEQWGREDDATRYRQMRAAAE